MTIISGVSVFQFVWNVHLFMGGFGLFTCKPTSPVTLDIYKWSRVPPGLASCKFIKHFTFSDWCWILKRLWFDQSQMWFIKWKSYMDDIPASPCIKSPHCKMSMISHFRNSKFEKFVFWNFDRMTTTLNVTRILKCYTGWALQWRHMNVISYQIIGYSAVCSTAYAS